jgi:hypothetical protein
MLPVERIMINIKIIINNRINRNNNYYLPQAFPLAPRATAHYSRGWA